MNCNICGMPIGAGENSGYTNVQHRVCPSRGGATEGRPAGFASSSGSPSDAPSVQQAKRGMGALDVSKPSHGKAEGESLDLSRLIRLPVSDLFALARKLEEFEKKSRACVREYKSDPKTWAYWVGKSEAYGISAKLIRRVIAKSAPQRSGGKRRKANAEFRNAASGAPGLDGGVQ